MGGSEVSRLRELGINAERVELVALLPLVQVAWADGEIQDTEREVIMDLGERYGLLDGPGRAIVEGWLAEAPSAFFRASVTRVLQDLGPTAFPKEFESEDVVAWCWALAEAAGGWFGTSARSVSSSERAALQEIADTLGVNADSARALARWSAGA